MTERFESTTRKLGAAWETFWYSQGGTFNLGLFRILFAYCLYREAGNTHKDSKFAIEDGFYLPYVRFIQPVTEQTFGLIHDLYLPLILLLALGLFSRFSGTVLLLLQGYLFFADRLNFRNHPYFFLLVLLIMLFSPADDALSIKSIFRALKNRQPITASLLGSQQPLTSQRLIQVQVCIVYLWAASHKLNMGYLSGVVLNHFLGSSIVAGRAWRILGMPLPEHFLLTSIEFLFRPKILMVLSVLTVLVEIVLPFTLWFRKTRPLAILLGIGFHLFIGMSMGILTFSIAMIATYLLFLDPETLVARLRSIRLREEPERVEKSKMQRDDKTQGRQKWRASTKR